MGNEPTIERASGALACVPPSVRLLRGKNARAALSSNLGAAAGPRGRSALFGGRKKRANGSPRRIELSENNPLLLAQ
jgi:hypothetical protein